MRRKDREVQDRQEIFDILRRCDTVRIGIQGEKYPLERCAGMARLMVGKIVLEEITGKKNLPGTMTPADKAEQKK